MWDNAFINDPLGYRQDQSQPTQDKDAQEFFDRITRERYEYCVRMAKLFKSEDGKKVLQEWREQTIEAGTWMPSIAMHHGKDAAIAHGFAREGQNSFVKHIEECIKVAHNCKTIEEFQAKLNQEGTTNLN